MESRHVSCVVAADPQSVYDLAVDPHNLPLWAHGLAAAPLRHDGGDLVVSSPMGEVRVRFVPRNDHGVLDHEVTLPSGAVVHNPFRVLRHPHGCEVVLTVRQLGLTDEEFDRDCGMVADDLARLKGLLEG